MEWMRIASLRTRHLTVFLAVARAGTMQRAAREVHLTQPAISKLIAELESIFGTPLFERSKRGVTLTESGKALVLRAEAVLNDLDNASLEIANIARGMVGSVRVGVLPVAEVKIVPAMLLALRKRAPRLSIRIEEGTRPFLLNALRKGEIDCVIGRLYGSADENDLHSETLVQMPIQIVARPSHPLSLSHRVSWWDLARHAWIMPQAGEPIRGVIDRQFAEAGITAPTPAIESTSVRLNCAVLGGTDMIGVMPDDAATEYAKTGELIVLQIKIADRLPLVGVMTRSSSAPNALKVLLEVLRSEIR
jgi:DNA-binding transcriptional LysR family regulator